MSEIKEQFVTYEIALKLKELAAEEAKVTYNSYIDLVDGCETYIVDKQSILDVINLIE